MGFKITIGDIIDEPDLKDCYIINLSYMHGDADMYTDGELGPFDANKDINKLQEALTICKNIKDVDPNDIEYIESIDGFDEWFNSDDDENPFATQIDTDVTCDNQCYCMLDDFNLVYYDKNGKVHMCYIEEEK